MDESVEMEFNYERMNVIQQRANYLAASILTLAQKYCRLLKA